MEDRGDELNVPLRGLKTAALFILKPSEVCRLFQTLWLFQTKVTPFVQPRLQPVWIGNEINLKHECNLQSFFGKIQIWLCDYENPCFRMITPVIFLLQCTSSFAPAAQKATCVSASHLHLCILAEAFYPKRFVRWEFEPVTLALLTPCSTSWATGNHLHPTWIISGDVWHMCDQDS